MNTFNTQKTPVSILALMKEAICENGSLSKEFVLPETNTKSQIKFAPGAMEGIVMYHGSGHGENDITTLRDALVLISESKYELAEQTVLNFFRDDESTTMLSYIDSIENWIFDNQKTLHLNHIYEFAVNIVRTSAHIEMIKFALSILGILNTGNDIQLYKELEILALSDEFTLFCAFEILNRTDDNKIIFDLAKKVNGWGRIHLVARLDATTEEIKTWCLCEGYKNSIMYEYSAMECVEKSDLMNKLQNNQLNSEQLVSAGELISLTLLSGPMASLSEYDFGETLLASYFSAIKPFALNYSFIKSASNIADFLCDNEWSSRDLLLENCNLYLKDPAAVEIVNSSLMDTKDFALAEKMGVECISTVYDLLESDFEDSNYLVHFLFSKNQRIDEAIALFTRKLPLSKMATGPQNELGLDPKFRNYNILLYIVQFLKKYPNHGEELIICALHSPVTNCRNMALTVLESWKENKVVFSTEIQKAICHLADCEINEKIKERLKPFSP